MMRWLGALFALVLCSGLAVAQDTLTFRGEAFVRKHEAANERGGLVEFVPPGEDLQGWTQLIGYRAIFDNRQTARDAALALARLAEQREPGTKARIRTKGGEALVDFVLTGSGGLIEVNLFKYARSETGGLLSFQYARRFRGLDPEDVRALCARAIAETANVDMTTVAKALTPQVQVSAGLGAR